MTLQYKLKATAHLNYKFRMHTSSKMRLQICAISANVMNTFKLHAIIKFLVRKTGAWCSLYQSNVNLLKHGSIAAWFVRLRRSARERTVMSVGERRRGVGLCNNSLPVFVSKGWWETVSVTDEDHCPTIRMHAWVQVKGNGYSKLGYTYDVPYEL